MRAIMFLFIPLILLFSSTIGQATQPPIKEIITEATYNAGDRDTPASAEEAVLMLAKRNALEQAGTFVTSKSTVQNFVTQEDTIKSLAANVMEVTILDKKRTMIGNNIEFWIKIKAIVHTDKLEQYLQSDNVSDKTVVTRNTDTIVNEVPTIKTDQEIYRIGEDIVLSWSFFPGNSTDWITIVPIHYPSNKYDIWWYTSGATSGKKVQEGTLPSGEYELRGYFDWSGTGSYEIKTRHRFTIVNR